MYINIAPLNFYSNTQNKSQIDNKVEQFKPWRINITRHMFKAYTKMALTRIKHFAEDNVTVLNKLTQRSINMVNRGNNTNPCTSS